LESCAIVEAHAFLSVPKCPACTSSFYSGEGVVYVGKVINLTLKDVYVTKVYVAIISAIYNSVSVDVFVPIIFHHVACAEELVPCLMPAIR
jgi:hypothetical protein